MNAPYAFKISFQISPVSGDTGKAPLPTISIDVSGDKKTVEPEKSSSAEEASPDAEEPVVLRKKKTPPDSDKASIPEEEPAGAKTVSYSSEVEAERNEDVSGKRTSKFKLFTEFIVACLFIIN